MSTRRELADLAKYAGRHAAKPELAAQDLARSMMHYGNSIEDGNGECIPLADVPAEMIRIWTEQTETFDATFGCEPRVHKGSDEP